MKQADMALYQAKDKGRALIARRYTYKSNFPWRGSLIFPRPRDRVAGCEKAKLLRHLVASVYQVPRNGGGRNRMGGSSA